MTSPKTDATQLELFAQSCSRRSDRTHRHRRRPRRRPPLFKAPTGADPHPAGAAARPERRAAAQIQLGSHTVHYVLRRSARRSHGFMINDDGLHVTSPRARRLADIDTRHPRQAALDPDQAVRTQRAAQRRAPQQPRWSNGSTARSCPTWAPTSRCACRTAARSHCVYDADARELRLGVTPGLERMADPRTRRSCGSRTRPGACSASAWTCTRRAWACSYNAFALSSAGTRWGSCTVAGNIRLNWKLVHYPLALLDYVVVHELAHLREMNHSPRFWAVVGEVFPDYDGAKAALRKRSIEMPVLFPDD